MSIFASQNKAAGLVTDLVAKTSQMLNSTRIGGSEVASYSLSTESLQDAQVNMVLSARDNFQVSLESFAKNVGNTEAATFTALISANPMAYLTSQHKAPESAISGFAAMDSVDGMGIAVEAYDETNNKNLQSYSIVYNMLAARQDEFGEAFFPTVTISPDQAGIDVTVRVLTVFSDKQRDLNGKLTDFEHKNVLRAYRKPEILKNEMTRAVPVVRPGSAANFVPASVTPARTIRVDGESISTSYLATGKTFDLITLSQRDSALNQSAADITDQLHPAVKLSNLLVSVTDGIDTDVLSFRVKDMPLTTFIQGNQNNYRNMMLNFETTSLMVNPTTKNVDGSALAVVEEVVNNNLFVRLRAKVTGDVNTETGETNVFGNMLVVHSVRNSAGEYLALDAGVGLSVVTAFADAKIVGYELDAYLTNSNRRQRGQLVNINYYTQPYSVPTRSPLTMLRPVLVDNLDTTGDLTSLINITNARTSGAAVESLIEAANLLNETVNVNANGETPEILGVSRKLVVPYYKNVDIDVAAEISSVSSHEKRMDIQSVLVNRIRDEVVRMYKSSEYQIALNAVNGGETAKPTVVIGTDPVIASYLNISGDNRILGDQFNCKVVTSVNEAIEGKIFITFTTGSTGTIDPMNFGNMLWQPSLVFSSKMTRNGAFSYETTVSPRFAHIVHTPVLMTMVVTNIPESIARTPLLFKNV